MSFEKKERFLFRIKGCPYCQRAEAALDEAKISYKKIEVQNPDRAVVQLLSGQPTVPVLVEVVGSKSQDDDILEYIAYLKANPQG